MSGRCFLNHTDNVELHVSTFYHSAGSYAVFRPTKKVNESEWTGVNEIEWDSAHNNRV